MKWWTLPAWMVVLYGALCVLVWLLQSRLIWIPLGQPGSPPRRMGESSVEECWLHAQDGIELHGWWIRGEGPRPAVLVCHGNGGNLSHREGLARRFVEAGFDVLLFDYRGYGKSEGSIDEEGSYLDAEAAWSFLVEEQGLKARDVLAYGESLGGAVALELALRREVGALFVESTFTSLPDMAAATYPFLPARWLCRPQYDSLAKAGRLRVPLLVTHGPDDEIVPFEQGRALYEAAPEPKRFLEREGRHNDPALLGQPGGLEELRTWWDARPRS